MNVNGLLGSRGKGTGDARHPRRSARLLLALGGALVLVLGVASARTATFRSTLSAVEPTPEAVVPEGAAERLAGALRIATISHEDPGAFDDGAFRALHAHLEGAFPRVHEQLTREVVATHSLLYTWPGSDPAALPMLLAGHLDVVPVEPGTEQEWQEGPFDGRVVDGFVWGRGALDDKSAVVAMLEAVEMLLGEGFHPTRTVFLAFGHDEEVGGLAGARQIAALLERRRVRLGLVLDEGGVIGEGILPGISAPVAMVGIAEKGFLSVELSTSVAGGHSSLPPQHSAIGILSAAVARLEAEPMPARLADPTRQLFERIGPRLSLAQRAMFANLWLTQRFVTSRLERSPTTNAMVRTTAAPTIFEAGAKDNVLPSQARAVVNFRILPGDSIAGALQHARRVIDDDRVEMRATGRFSAEPSAVSSSESEEFRALERAILTVAPDAVVAPYQVVVTTDARHFAGLGGNVFRFVPLRLDPRDLTRMHGTDERVAIRDYEQAVRFYRHLISNSDLGDRT